MNDSDSDSPENRTSRFRQIRDLFDQTLQLPGPARSEFLARVCGPDADLRIEVEKMAAAHETRAWFDQDPLAPTEMLKAGDKLGQYEVSGLLGTGAMGQVYRAHDSALRRDVAIKILPPEFWENSDRVRRFRREAETLATLNHSNIGQIYELKDIEGDAACCLVLELVEGESLDVRLQRGPLPVREALAVAIQIAQALETAHERGVVHRDLKPANIRVRADGQVKVLDFGLATTLSVNMDHIDAFEMGLPADAVESFGLVGTPLYMAPELIQGRPADTKSDIWAFGCVLYELLTATRAFGNGAVFDVLSRILEQDPDWNGLPAKTPSAIRSLLRRCLQKDPSQRLKHIGDARFQIEEGLAEPLSMSVSASSLPRASNTGWWVAAVMSLLSIVLAVLTFSPRTKEQQDSNTLPPAEGSSVTSFNLSPDGEKTVLQGWVDGRSQLLLKRRGSETLTPLPGTASTRRGEMSPCWSPDGKSIAVFLEGGLKRIDVATSTEQILDAEAVSGGCTWSAGGIVYATSYTSPLYFLQPGSENPRKAITDLAATQTKGHAFPFFLPDQKHFLFFAYGAKEKQGIYIASIDGSMPPHRFVEGASAAVFAAPDNILYVKDQTLIAQKVNLSTMTALGESFPVVSPVASDPMWLVSAVSVAADGKTIAYRRSGIERQLQWFNRKGIPTSRPCDPNSSMVPTSVVRILSDPEGGSAILNLLTTGGNSDLHRYRLDEDRCFEVSKITDGRAFLDTLALSRDGNRLVFNADNDTGKMDLYLLELSAGRTAAPKLLLADDGDKFPFDITRRYVLYGEQGNLFVLADDGTKTTIADTPAEETSARFSADERCIAYQSNEAGQSWVYLRKFSEPSAAVRILEGSAPQWRKDGEELYFIQRDAHGDHLMAVSVVAGGCDAASIRLPAHELFRLPIQAEYEASEDGQHFLVKFIARDASPITILRNWHAEAH